MMRGWEGRGIRLAPLNHERHFENCVRWLNDPAVTEWLLVGDLPLTRLAEQDYFERAARGGDAPTDVTFAIETREEPEEHIGMCGLMNISYRHGVAAAGIFIGRERLWGRGHGSDAFAVLTHYALHVLGLRMVLADVFSENRRSMRMMEKCGYQQVGAVPGRYWKRGAYRDSVLWFIRRG